MDVSRETLEQTHQRLLRVLAAAEFLVYPGLYGYHEYPRAEFPAALIAEALAFVRDEDVWSVLGPATPAVREPLRLFAFHFAAGLDNSRVVRWLGTPLHAPPGVAVVR